MSMESREQITDEQAASLRDLLLPPVNDRDAILMEALPSATETFAKAATYSDLYGNNQARRLLASKLLERMAYQELAFLKPHVAKADTANYEIAQYMAYGTAKDQQNRVSFTKAGLQHLTANLSNRENQAALLKIYSSKAGDLVRALFDSSSPNGMVTNNLADEARTLATLQLVMAGDNDIIESAKLGYIDVVGIDKNAVVTTDRMQEAVRTKILNQTNRVLEDHLWLINAAVAVDQANPRLGKQVFGQYTGTALWDGLNSGFRQQRIPFAVNMSPDGNYFRPFPNSSETVLAQQWRPFAKSVSGIFGPAAPDAPTA